MIKKSHRSIKLIICVVCKKEKLHEAKGLCKSCYMKQYFKNNPQKKNRRKRKGSHHSKKIIICKKCKTKTFHEAKGLCRKCYDKYYYRKTKKYRIKHRLNKQNRRVRLRGHSHKFTKEEWQLKLNKTKGICPGCSKNIGIANLTIDHIIPLSKSPEGFIYTINDVQPLCHRCNSKKGIKIIHS